MKFDPAKGRHSLSRTVHAKMSLGFPFTITTFFFKSLLRLTSVILDSWNTFATLHTFVRQPARISMDLDTFQMPSLDLFLNLHRLSFPWECSPYTAASIGHFNNMTRPSHSVYQNRWFKWSNACRRKYICIWSKKSFIQCLKYGEDILVEFL